MTKTLFALYQRLVLQHPVIWVLLALLVSGYAAWESRHFRLDASADSLILENDKALEFYREVSKRYGGSEFLIITYEPTQSALFSREALSDLATLQGRLAELPRVASVYSMLDVPLLFSPQVRFSDLANGYSTLRDEDANLSLAKEEFTGGSPLYRDLLVNRDGDTTALLINFERDATYYELLNRRNALRDQERAGELDNAGAQQLARANREFSDYSAKRQAESAAEIATIRAIMDQHRDSAQLFLGGAPMIASDAVGFVRSDLEVFGIGVTLFLILALLVIFRRLRWIALPMLCCGLTVLWVSGWLGLMDWKVTVISSNFVSLLLIITMSMTIHLIVRYRELQAEQPDADQPALVRDTMGHMLRPVIYTSLTTMVAFASLVFSGIRPVIDFGWMMTIGIGLALVLCLVLFPAVLALLPKQPPQTLRDFTRRATLRISDFNRGHGIKLLVGCALVVIVSLIGTSRLTVENRFIDYFQKDTEIYQGMVEIDRNLGGTTPLDIVIDAPAGHQPRVLEDDPFADPFAGGFGDEGSDDFGDDPFADPFAATQQADPLENAYWYTPQRLEQLLEIQHYLESLPETGKVLSIASTYEVAKMINNGPLSYVDLMLLASFVPEDLRGQLVRPYLSEDGNQVRISVRVIDSDKNLNRNDLLQKIQHDLQQNFDLAPEQVKLTGAMVLYNNMLQSLFDSQIKTLGFVFLAIFVMFLVLFRSPGISLIAMLPNLFSAAFILGLMGWIGLPLDIMTITIAAITIGIAVDDSIHYIHRFREEFPKDQDYLATMRRCHGSIGTAIYYTSLTIIAGFSILVVSNFNPTVYFGALTSLAMLVALLANLTLLPAMLVTVKPKIPPV
ncbi:transporter [Isoalcanivorax pacificus W11-5]|uniref:Transporter n=1 Tax=Isoalcanivorax pacificus W11-5 TaxID=391936 RepID=A0A0B4XLN4_9GAMM|nr:efflux RND transporter permease subunit [Isoalcanivorax pacificus]AJD47605.1 transporter [Isoalcanivorax pacificus W11-5]